MRILVFGREKTIKRLSVFLAKEGIEVVGISDGLDKMMAVQKQSRFDLAILDSWAEEAEAACHHIHKFWGTPLVLIVNKRQVDWKRMQSLGANGYLPEEAGEVELAARIRATLRRFLPLDNHRKSALD